MAVSGQIDTRFQKSTDFLQFDTRRLPPLEVFFDVGSGSDGAPLRAAFIEIITNWARRWGFDLLTLELSVIADPRGTPIGGAMDLSFTSNFWVNPVVAGSLENADAILRGYQATIRGVADDGTLLNDGSFHRLHFVHMSIDATALHASDISAPADAETLWDFTRESVPIHLPRGPARKPAGVDMTIHHERFGARLLDNLGKAGAKLPFKALHYLSVPCERLASDRETPADGVPEGGVFPLEPSSAIFLTFAHVGGGETGPLAQHIGTVATELQYVLSMMCQRQSAWFADRARLAAEVHRRTVEAYDSVGHALRTFLGVTDYQQALDSVMDAIDGGGSGTDQQKAALLQARATLEMFRHIEGLGSIFRLHGWIKDIDSNLVLGRDSIKSAREKVLRCYDTAVIGSWCAGKNASPAPAQLADALARYLAPISARTGRLLRLYVVGAGVPVTLHVDLKFWEEMDRFSGYAFPPFSPYKVHSNALLLAVLTAVLEPVRNAEDHLRRALSSADAKAKPIDIFVAAHQTDGYEVFVGNAWLGGDRPPDVSGKSGGVKLVNEVLRDVMLGQIDGCHPSRAMFENVGVNATQVDDWSERYAWVRLLIEPAKLYERVQRGEAEDGVG